MHEQERRLNPEEQRQVIELAARLQAADETSSLPELAVAASEAGIDPKFVEQAVEELAKKAESASALQPLRSAGLYVLGPIWLVSCWASFFYLFYGAPDRWAGAQIWVALLSTMILGAILGRGKRFVRPFVTLLGAAVIIAVLAAGYVYLGGGSVAENWSRYLQNLLLAISSASLFGALLARAANRISNIPSPSVDKTPGR